jgi:DNA-directed RNA polymerase subunit RPC12/RpoP
MSDSTDIEIVTLEAKCGSCGKIFDYPTLSDFAYGQFIFCGENGRVHAYCEVFNPATKLLEVLLPENCGAELYQSALAELADPILGQKLKTKMRCPNCTSLKLEYWGGKKTGSMWVKPTTYNNLLSLSRNELIQKVSNFARDFRATSSDSDGPPGKCTG